MPDLPLPEEPALPGANTLYFPMMSAMLYPRDSRKAFQWFAAAMVGAYSFWQAADAPEEILSDFHGWIGAVWEFKQAPQRVFKDGIDRTSRASLSGAFLLLYLRVARHHPEHCKLERVKALAIEHLPADGKTVSESLLNKSWAEFKGVSHLWAAFGLISDEGFQDEDESTPGNSLPENANAAGASGGV